MRRAVVCLLLPFLVSCIQRREHAAGPPYPAHTLAPEHGHGGGHDHGRAHMEKGTPEERIARYENAEREAWQKPDEVVRALALPEDATVADLGSGSGYFSIRLAKALPKGRVIGLDIEPAFVRYLTERAAKEGVANVEARQVGPDDPGLVPASVDLVLIVDVYHHLENRPAYLGKLKDALEPGGRVAIVDFTLEAKHGPPARHRLTKEQVLGEAEAAGFVLVREHGFLPEQYFLELAVK